MSAIFGTEVGCYFLPIWCIGLLIMDACLAVNIAARVSSNGSTVGKMLISQKQLDIDYYDFVHLCIV